MRSPVRAALAALVFTAASAAVHPAAAQAAAATAPKLAYVDVATVLEQVPGRADAQRTLETEGQAIQAELTRMQDSLQALGVAYQKAQATLTPAQRQTREREFQSRQQEYQQRATALQERGSRRQQELAGGFETLVRQAIDDVRSAGGYTMIFASGPNSPMLAADKSLDVTDQVLARIRTVAAARGGAAAGGARPAAGAAAGAARPAAGAAPAAAGAARPRTP